MPQSQVFDIIRRRLEEYQVFDCFQWNTQEWVEYTSNWIQIFFLSIKIQNHMVYRLHHFSYVKWTFRYTVIQDHEEWAQYLIELSVQSQKFQIPISSTVPTNKTQSKNCWINKAQYMFEMKVWASDEEPLTHTNLIKNKQTWQIKLRN